MSSIYITTTLPYVNAEPHIGFALEIIRADVLARHYREIGCDVFFNFGTDEHGKKIYDCARAAGKEPRAYADEYAAKFQALKEALNVTYDNFVRTTDTHHITAAQEFWRRCAAAGDIYKKQYQIKYCVGCELEKQESEIADSKCPLHPNYALELIDEENYFFRFSKYQKPLLDLYFKHPDLVAPDSRLNEIRAFVTRGLSDFSISRLQEKMPWGIPVPNDDKQVMYVWFDALVNYISAIGWPDNMAKFERWWPATQVCGKDNLRQQSAMWQAMLMSVGLPPSRRIYVNGFVISGGQKMSKSLGNVINPLDIIGEYGTDGLRYYLLRETASFEDSDITIEKFKDAYNANLANGLGNLVSRILKMSEEYLVDGQKIKSKKQKADKYVLNCKNRITDFIEQYEFGRAMDVIFGMIADLDRVIQEKKPFIVWKTDPEAARVVVRELVAGLADIALLLRPFMPATTEKIEQATRENKMPAPLFVRKK